MSMSIYVCKNKKETHVVGNCKKMEIPLSVSLSLWEVPSTYLWLALQPGWLLLSWHLPWQESPRAKQARVRVLVQDKQRAKVEEAQWCCTQTLSLSPSLSLFSFLKSQTQLCEALIIQAAATPTTQIHGKNAKVHRKKKKKKNPLKTHKTQPHSNRRSLTHSLTHSFHKNEIPLQISFCEGCFLLQRHTQWPEKKYSREHDLLRQGKCKESRRTQILQQKPKKKKKKKKKGAPKK